MLSDNIRNYRKKNYMSQDELAEKVGVSRQSVSFWENGQTQPTIDNIIALSKIFNISSDTLLGNSDNVNTAEDTVKNDNTPKKNNKIWSIVAIGIAAAVAVTIIAIIIFGAVSNNSNSDKDNLLNHSEANSVIQADALSKDTLPDKNNPENSSKSEQASNAGNTTPPSSKQFDLFTYCKNFAIEKGTLNGDYSIYQQPATKYGGYDNEYFSISYWGDSNMVEFCLHCPLNETQSHNFYLRMRGGYNGKYEYLSSKYYRENGESIRSAMGYIDPAVFTDNYPISCDDYQGTLDGQTEFMEQSRVGICDLINCLKKFVTTENMDCEFSDFQLINF